ncbi:MAG: hypothetical protein Q8N51_05775 [Gammaproteobacteria bacterium]|nr:hypothetical protein [Gammaproteobacteria bacterium]
MSAQKYISHRNVTVTSLCGRSMEFKKGEPALAPPQMHAELLAMGIMPVDGLEDDVVKPENVEPSLTGDREAAMFGAFETMVLRDRRGDFMASGAPHGAVLAKELGWEPIQAKEREAAWAKWNLGRSGK